MRHQINWVAFLAIGVAVSASGQAAAQRDSNSLHWDKRPTKPAPEIRPAIPAAVVATPQTEPPRSVADDSVGNADRERWRKLKQVAEDGVRSSLVDPGSAEFEWPYGFVTGYWKPMLRHRIEGQWTCGKVNAKNRMGGYVGRSTFVVVVQDGAVAFVDIDPGGRDGLVQEQCEKGREWLPAPQDGMLDVPRAAPTNGGMSVADELAKLAALRDRGVISSIEFESQKAKLLGR